MSPVCGIYFIFLSKSKFQIKIFHYSEIKYARGAKLIVFTLLYSNSSQVHLCLSLLFFRQAGRTKECGWLRQSSFVQSWSTGPAVVQCNAIHVLSKIRKKESCPALASAPAVYVCISHSGIPPWTLKRGGLENYGQILISPNEKK